MKKIMLIFILLMVLVGCGSKEFVCPDGRVVSDSNQCNIQEKVNQDTTPTKEIESKPASVVENKPVEVKEVVVEAKLDPKIQTLIDKSSTVKSLSYYLRDNNLDKKYNVKVNDKYMKLTFASVFYDIDGIEAYNNIYLDLVNKKAWVTCELSTRCSDENKAEIEYDGWYQETPLDKLKLIKGDVQIISTQQCDANKKCLYVKAGDYEIGIWDYKGLPVVIKSSDGDIEYQRLAYNSVKDSDFDFIQ